MRVKSNIHAFQRSIRETMRATRKTEADALNKACLNVAYRAAQFTPFADKGRIRSKFEADDLLAKLASRNLKQSQGRFTRAEHKKEMKRIATKAFRSIKALRGSWANAVTAMGGTFRGKKPIPGSSSSRGTGKRATPLSLVARITSAIITKSGTGHKTTAEEIRPLVAALDKAVGFVAHDMHEYAERKIRETLRKHSSK